jgi:hypothetical protein
MFRPKAENTRGALDDPIFAFGSATPLGRGSNRAKAETAARRAPRSEEKLLGSYDFFVRGWEARVSRALAESNPDQGLAELNMTKSRALRPLANNAGTRRC